MSFQCGDKDVVRDSVKCFAQVQAGDISCSAQVQAGDVSCSSLIHQRSNPIIDSHEICQARFALSEAVLAVTSHLLFFMCLTIVSRRIRSMILPGTTEMQRARYPTLVASRTLWSQWWTQKMQQRLQSSKLLVCSGLCQQPVWVFVDGQDWWLKWCYGLRAGKHLGWQEKISLMFSLFHIPLTYGGICCQNSLWSISSLLHLLGHAWQSAFRNIFNDASAQLSHYFAAMLCKVWSKECYVASFHVTSICVLVEGGEK